MLRAFLAQQLSTPTMKNWDACRLPKPATGSRREQWQ